MAAGLFYRKNMQRNKQVAMGRKKFNMDPKKVREGCSEPQALGYWFRSPPW